MEMNLILVMGLFLNLECNIRLRYTESFSSPILYPESSGSLARGWSPGETGELEFYYCRISAVKQCKPLQGSQSKNLNFFEFSRVSPGD